MKGFTGIRWAGLGRAHGVIQSNCESTNPSRHSGASTQPVARRGFFDWFTRTITTTTALVVWLAIGLFTVPAHQALAQTTCAIGDGPYTYVASIQLPSGLDGGECNVADNISLADEGLPLSVHSRLSAGRAEWALFSARIGGDRVAPSSLTVDGQPSDGNSDGRLELYYTSANSNGEHTAIGEVILGGTVYRVDMAYTQTDTGIEVTSATITGGHFGGTVESTDHTAPAGYGVEIDQSSIDNSNVTDVSFGLRLAEFGSTYKYTFKDAARKEVTGTGTVVSLGHQVNDIDLSSLNDGTITLSVTLTDPAGNEGDPATASVEKSVTGPQIHVYSHESNSNLQSGGTESGDWFPNVEKTRRYTVFNIGNAELEVSAITVDTSNLERFNIDGSPAISNQTFTVAAGGSAEFSISYTPDDYGFFRFDVSITSDSTLDSSFLFTVSGIAKVDPTPPVADAGPDQTVNAGAPVTLDGTGSTDNFGTIASYAWLQVDGDGSDTRALNGGIQLDVSTPSQPAFVAPSVTTPTNFYFRLTVTAGDYSHSDWVTVSVNPAAEVTVSSIKRKDPATEDTKESSLEFEITFSNAINPSTFTAGDITLTQDPTGTFTGYTIGAPVASGTDNKVFTVTVSNLSGDGKVGLSLAGSSITDSINRDVNTADPTGDDNQTYNVDTVAPQVDSVVFQNSSGASVPSVDPGDSFKVVVTFNEKMDTTKTPPAIAYYTETGGSGSVTDPFNWTSTGSGGWDTDGKVYTFTYTVNDPLRASVQIRSVVVSNATDVPGNDLDANSNTKDASLDVTENDAPAVSTVVFKNKNGNITDQNPVALGSEFQVVITYDEAMDDNFAPTIVYYDGTLNSGNQVSLPASATATNGWNPDYREYTFNYKVPDPLEDSLIFNSLRVSGAKDAAGNEQTVYMLDEDFTLLENTPPTVDSVVFQNSGGNPVDTVIPGDSFKVVVTFDEKMDTTRTPAIAYYTETGGSGGTGTTTKPTDWAATGSGSWDTDGKVYTFPYTVNDPLSASVQIRSVVVANATDVPGNDLDANYNTKDVSLDITENDAPQVSSVQFLNSTAGKDSDDMVVPGDSFQVVVTYDETMDLTSAPTVVYYDASGGVVTLPASATAMNGWSSGLTVYTFNYTIPDPLDASLIVGSLKISNAKDASGNLQEDYDGDATFKVNENTPPTLTIVTIKSNNTTDNTQATTDDVITLTFTASETLKEAPVVTIANQTATVTGPTSSNQYEATIKVDSSFPAGAVTFAITNLEDVNENAADDVTTTTDNSSVTIDLEPPSVTITAPAEVRGPFEVTITFSEDVSQFELADITVGNGVASDFAGSDDVYTATITPRVGVTSARTLFYATAGVAWLKGNYTALNNNDLADSGSAELDATGFVVGGGLEHALRDNLLILFEGLHYAFDDRISTSDLTSDSDVGDFAEVEDITIYRVGLSYKFNFGGRSEPSSLK